MKVSEINDFEGIRDDWNRILRDNKFGDNIFLTIEWLSTWWKHFGGQRKLLLLTVEEDKEVLGIAPLMLSKYKLPAFGSIKKIEFLGTRHSDYNNFIFSKKEYECVKAVVDYLDDFDEWDWIELKEIPELGSFPSSTFGNFSRNLDLKERVCNVCPYVNLPNNYEILRKNFGKNLRQNLNRYIKKIRDLSGEIDLKRFDEAGFSAKEAMNTFIKLHEEKWNAFGKPGAFADDAFRSFHLDVADTLDRNGWLGIYFLRAKGEPIASQYTFEYSQKMYYYLGGFLPDYSNLSVGNLIIMFLLKECIDKGYSEYDMMRGNEPYKLKWTSTFRRNFEVRLVRKKVFSTLYDWVTWGKTVENIATKLKISLGKTE